MKWNGINVCIREAENEAQSWKALFEIKRERTVSTIAFETCFYTNIFSREVLHAIKTILLTVPNLLSQWSALN
jgi:hypothetical protein